MYVIGSLRRHPSTAAAHLWDMLSACEVHKLHPVQSVHTVHPVHTVYTLPTLYTLTTLFACWLLPDPDSLRFAVLLFLNS